jgi:hypothetical protein
MNASCLRFLWVVVLGSVVVAQAWAEDKKRNPFDFPDIENPDGDDVQEYSKKVELKGGKDDANAKEWVTEATEGKKGSIDGEWRGRWNSYNDADAWLNDSEAAKIKTVGDRVYMVYKGGGQTYLVDCKRDKNTLVGRYKNINNADDAGTCKFLIVDDERIDGDWAGAGRWDFRRKLK